MADLKDDPSSSNLSQSHTQSVLHMDFLNKYSKELVDNGISHTLLTQNTVENTDVKVLYSFLTKSNPTEWHVLGRCLDLPPSELNVLKVDAHSEPQRIMKVLDKWLVMNPEPTYLSLLVAISLTGEFESFITEVFIFLSKKFQTEKPIKPAHYDSMEPEVGSETSDTSEYHSQHSIPEFTCHGGCDCSIKDWLESGCKKAGQLENYPKLDIKHLSVDEQEILIRRLDRETKAVQKKFISLSLQVSRWLSSNASIDELKYFLSSLTTFAALRNNDTTLLSNEIGNINDCTTVINIFKILNKYWSWINHELLGDIIEQFCEDDVTIDEALKKYQEQVLEPFLKRTVIEIPSNSYGHLDIPNYKKLIFKLGTDMESHSGSSIPLIREKLSKILRVDQKALHIARVKDGCMEVTFSVPKVVLSTVFPLSKEVQIQLAGFEVNSKLCRVEQIVSQDFSYTWRDGSSISSYMYKANHYPLSSIPELASYSPQSSVATSFEEEITNVAFPLKEASAPTISFERQDTAPFSIARQDSNEDSKSSSSMQTNCKQASVSMFDSSGYHTCKTTSVEKDAESDTNKTDAISRVTAPEMKASARRPHSGIVEICKACFELNKTDPLLHEFQCFQSDTHDHVEWVHVAWDKSRSHWEQIRNKPAHYIPNRKAYGLCAQDERCGGENCTFAHSKLECNAWNYELRKRRNSDESVISNPSNPLCFHPGEVNTVKLSQRSWRTNFRHRLTLSRLDKARLDLPLSKDNYRQRFYNLLCFEEMEHIDKLTEKCDGKFRLFIYDESPEFLQDKSAYSSTVYGYLTSPMLKSHVIDYATQASEAVYFVKFENTDMDGKTFKGNKKDVCKVRIHSHNFTTTEEKLFVQFSSFEQQAILQNFDKPLNEECYMIDVEFEVKHYYFDTLHSATVKLSDSMVEKLLPSPHKQDFPLYSIEQINWTSFSKRSTFLHLDPESQISSLQRIVSCHPNVPFILSGPFGSGKTRVLACAALYFALSNVCSDPVRIIICAHHQQSTETFIDSYFGRLMEKDQEVKAKVQVVHIVRGKFVNRRGFKYSDFYKTIPEFKEWFNHNYDASKPIIVISTYMNSLSLYEILQVPGFGFFSHFLLDEAAQVREPEAIAPLSLATRDAKIVLAGDHFQVGPNTLVLGQEAITNGLNLSLLERLLKLYESCDGSISKQYYTQLNVIYRCHQSLLPLPGKLFYNGALRHGRRHPSVHSGPHGYKFVATTARESPPPDSTNEHEAIIVLDEVTKYCLQMKKEDGGFKPFQACIISSSRNQLNTMKELIKKRKHYETIKGVKFLPSYIIQGYEFKAIFLSLCDSFIDGKVFHGTKSLCNPLVFNTAITRAKAKVVAIGDPFKLLEYESTKSPYAIKPWKEYLRLCIEQKTITCSDLDKLKVLV